MKRHTPGQVQLRPNVPPVPWVQEQARRRLAGYHAQIENLDAHLGRIYEVLAEEGILDDTEILFFSDHGDCMGSHGFFEKSSPWEESIRIPFLWAGRTPYRGRGHGPNQAMISAIDIAPTTLGIAGIETPKAMGGFDFSPIREKGPPLLVHQSRSTFSKWSASSSAMASTVHGAVWSRPTAGSTPACQMRRLACTTSTTTHTRCAISPSTLASRQSASVCTRCSQAGSSKPETSSRCQRSSLSDCGPARSPTPGRVG